MFWAMAYQYGWADIEQLRQAVILEQLTPEQFLEITGENAQ